MAPNLVGSWRVDYQEESWPFEPDDLTVGQILAIEREFGDELATMLRDVDRGRPEACQVLIWWLRGMKQDRLQVDIMPRRVDVYPVTDPKGRPIIQNADGKYVLAESLTAEADTSEPSPTSSESTASDSTS